MDLFKRARLEPRGNLLQKNGVKRVRSTSITSYLKKNPPANAVIFDNGGYSIKVGYSRNDTCTLLPNHIMKAKSERKRCFIADQVEDCRDLSGLFYIMPHDHGYIAKFDVQKTIWDYTFHKFPIDELPVIMTQPILNFRFVQEYMDEIFFEEYDVKSLIRANATDLSRHQYIEETNKGPNTPCIVLDSGFSFTHIVPYINGKKYLNGITRLDIGGKLLTNYLKDILSYRQLHVMEETYVINQVKEDTCFMSEDFKRDMKIARTTNDIVKTYVLPDFHHVRRGYVQSDVNNQLAENCQILKLNNERISVPEVLMRPSIVPGMEQAGLAQSIAHSISKCPEEYHKLLTENIVLTGGNCLFPGFARRVELDTRALLPSNHKLYMHQPVNPIDYAWQGGRTLSKSPTLKSELSVTKQNYEEYGSNYIYKKFNDYTKLDDHEKPKTSEQIPFSYLNFWKKNGVDLFGKEQMTHKAAENDLEFILEGDGIEEFDGKYVTIDFEYQKQAPKVVEPIPTRIEAPIIIQPAPVHVSQHIPQNIQILSQHTIGTQSVRPIKRKKISLLKSNQSVLPPMAPLSNTIKQVRTITQTAVSANKVQNLANLVTTKPVPKLQPRIYKPVFNHQRVEPPKVVPQLLTLNTTNLTLNGSQFIVNNTPGTKSVSLLNKTVLVPQTIMPKNVTLQLIPFRPDLIRPNTTNFLITKKTQ